MPQSSGDPSGAPEMPLPQIFETEGSPSQGLSPGFCPQSEISRSGDSSDQLEQPQEAACISICFSREPVDLEAWKADAVLDEESEVLGLSEKSRAGGDHTYSLPPPQENPVCPPELGTVCGVGEPVGSVEGWVCCNGDSQAP